MISKILIIIIRFYQQAISPHIGPACRYQPTCSEYCIHSLIKYGVFKGLLLASRRILSCHPWGGHGHDPVP